MKFIVDISVDNNKSELYVQKYLTKFILDGFSDMYDGGYLVDCPKINIKLIK